MNIALPSLKDVPLRTWYSSGRDDLLKEFYVPCLKTASNYDRAAGYFRSSIFSVAGLAFADFVERGGAARLICSPHLTEPDIAAINQGESESRVIDAKLIRELHEIARQPGSIAGLRFLSTLLSTGALEMRIAYRPGSLGIFHDKVGVFRSYDSCAVAFMGSSNESQAAVLSEWNHESFAAFASWGGSADAERVSEMSAYFSDLWNGRERNLVVSRLGDVPREEIEKHRHPGGIEAAAEAWRSEIWISNAKPLRETSQSRSLMRHQASVVNNWEERGFSGIVKHATGAGKTLTAIEMIRRWVSMGRAALVLVPSDLLLIQWKKELAQELSDISPAILPVGGTQSSRNWIEDLPDFTRDAEFLGPRVVIATMQTAATERFMQSAAFGSHLLVVADEVHRIGSSQHRRILCGESGAQVGLSATPERHGDSEGTSQIFGYFGPILEPEFGIPDAIKCGRLVPYDYHVHPVTLNEEEQKHWDELTQRIKLLYARLPDDGAGGKSQNDQFRMLLYKRASILKKAEGKIELAVETLRRQFAPGDRWLVYCDDSQQLQQVLDRLRHVDLDAYEYWSAMEGSRSATLDYFMRNGGILVAIRCLDEGIDLPSVNRALILASSSNPREFIQRRGRVLRRSDGKYKAIIHDVLVVPNGDYHGEIDTRPILEVEIARAAEFARYAQNRAVSHKLDDLAIQYGVDSIFDQLADHEDEL